MAIARVLYSDLFLSFSLPSAADSRPNQTTAANIITNLYREAYRIIYNGSVVYAAYDVGAEDEYVDTDVVKGVIIKTASRILEAMGGLKKPSGEQTKLEYNFSEEEEKNLTAFASITMRFPSHEDAHLEEQGDDVI